MEINDHKMMNHPLIIGHRGAKGLVAENTLESIQKALDHRVAGVEIDIHRCNTGELVVIHDETVDRTTNGKGKVCKLTLEDLKTLEIDGQYKIPTLDEVLQVIDGRCLLNIELKGEKTAKLTVKAIQECLKNKKWSRENFLVSSFDWSQLQKVQKLDPEIRLGVLSEGKLKKAFRMAKKLNAYAIHPDYTLLKRHHMWRAKRRGLKVFTWTVNAEEAVEKVKNLNVTAIITDYPDRYATV